MLVGSDDNAIVPLDRTLEDDINDIITTLGRDGGRISKLCDFNDKQLDMFFVGSILQNISTYLKVISHGIRTTFFDRIDEDHTQDKLIECLRSNDSISLVCKIREPHMKYSIQLIRVNFISRLFRTYMQAKEESTYGSMVLILLILTLLRRTTNRNLPNIVYCPA